jgi:MFS family permease
MIPALKYLPDIRSQAPGAATSDGSAPLARRHWPAGLAAALAAMFLGQIAFYSVPVQVPFLVEDHFHATSVASGAVIAVQTLTTGVVSLRFARIRRLAGERSLVAVAFACIGIGYLVLFMAPHVAVLAVGTLVMGAGLGVLMPNLNNWVINAAPPEARSRYAGFLTTALFLGQFLAPVVTQPVVNALDIQPLFLVIALGALLVAAVYLTSARRGTRAAAASPTPEPRPDDASEQPGRKAGRAH